MFSYLDTAHVTDRQTDKWTQHETTTRVNCVTLPNCTPQKALIWITQIFPVAFQLEHWLQH